MRTVYEASDIDLEHLTTEQKVLDSMVMLVSLHLSFPIHRTPNGELDVESFRRHSLAGILSMMASGGWKLERITEPIPEGLRPGTGGLQVRTQPVIDET